MIDAESLLRLRGLAKRRISRKARLLHHIYTWTRIIYESTFVLRNYDNIDVGAVTGLHTTAPARQPHPDNLDGGLIGVEGHDRLDAFLRLERNGSDENLREVTACINRQKEHEDGLRDIHLEEWGDFSEQLHTQLYGVSETWLSLVSQTTRLANVMDYLSRNRQHRTLELTEWLERRRQRLEERICAFAATASSETGASTNRTVEPSSWNLSPQSCMVRALNSALVIFFYRRIRDVSPWILQVHVEAVIKALKDFETACQAHNTKGPGSPWAPFMAGCEAVTPDQKEYISGWFQRAFEQTGFARFASARSGIHDVWKRREQSSRGRDRQTAGQVWSWVHVSQVCNVHYLLS